MSNAESARLLLFVIAVAVVFVWAAAVLARFLLRRQLPGSRAEQIILLLAVLGVACVVDGFTEPYLPTVTHLRIPLRELPRHAPPIRLVEISDLHSGARARLENELPELIRSQRPDLIFFAGDLLSSPEGLPVAKATLKQLAAIAPTFAVRGNWDMGPWAGLDLFGGTGVRPLDGEMVEATVRGQPISIAGAAFGSEGMLPRLLANAPAGEPSIVLYHSPDPIVQVANAKADLMLAGHTHGGQIRLPWYGALVTFSHFGKRFEAGLYRVRDTWLYVNRGLGAEPDVPLRIRFLCRPEITVIDLASEQN